MPQKAIELPCFLAHRSYLPTYVKTVPNTILFVVILYKMFNIFLLPFYVRNILNHFKTFLWGFYLFVFAMFACRLFCDLETLGKF